MGESRNDIARLARRALGWWLSELAALLPARARRLLSADTERLVVAPEGEEAAFAVEAGDSWRELGRMPIAEAIALHRAGASLPVLAQEPRLAQRLRQGKTGICVRLPAGQALQRRLTLPAAVEADLDQVLRFELDRRTPFSAETACYAYSIAARDEAGLHVLLTVAPRAAVQEASAFAAKLGLAATRVDVAAAAGAVPSGNLLPPTDAGQRRGLVAALRVACLVMFGCGAAGLYWMQHDAGQRLADLRAEVRAAKDIAEQAEAIKGELSLSGEGGSFLAARKAQMAPVSQILAELSTMLPDDTWLVQLNLNGNQLQVAGLSGSASALIPVLGQSPLLTDPKFHSAVHLDQATGRERFELAIGIAAKDMP